jgi:hypothetical protein
MYKEYSNINQKISLETKKGNLTRIKSWYAYTTTLYSSPPLNLDWIYRIRLGYLRGCLEIMIYLKDGE